MNALVANSLVGSDKFLPNKGSPICLGDRAERIMSASAVERPSAIHKHFLNQMLPAAEKDVSDIFVVLDDAAKFLLHHSWLEDSGVARRSEWNHASDPIDLDEGTLVWPD